MFEGNDYHAAVGLLLPHTNIILQGKALLEDVPVFWDRRIRGGREFRPRLNFPSCPDSRNFPGLLVLLPFFLSLLLAINLGALVISRFLFPLSETVKAPEVPDLQAGPSGPVEIPVSFTGLSGDFLRSPESYDDVVLDSYRNPETREWTVGFFELICGSPGIARAILEESERHSISPSLAFALSWEESRFNPRAENRKNRDGSIDRGLFQLNNRSFPKLTEAEFFNPQINAWYGMNHLRFCLDAGDSELSAVAMYNAGTTRVRSNGTPYQTLNYAARVFSTRRNIDSVFLEEWTRRQEILWKLQETEDKPPAALRENAAPRKFWNILPALLPPISR
ncbi:MAG: transglycosylase SLT domain-containing protein [Treponema sp.]|nr:transglycosylase SLT domain-containing protein [Treponema sp.]